MVQFVLSVPDIHKSLASHVLPIISEKITESFLKNLK